MTNSKSIKRALFSSVVALFLCFSMLLGTTFAWFTDSAVSGSNVITAGNLDIVVEYTLDGTNWKNLDGATDLFKKGLWEPGHTEVVALRITNNGTLALKYNANMNIVSEKPGTNKADNEFKLSEILTVSTGIYQKTNDVDPFLGYNISEKTLELAFADESSVVLQNIATFAQGSVLGSDKQLMPEETHYLIVRVDMAESVGNEANHKGPGFEPSINFGVNVLATQFTYEEDSFGKDYDEDSTYPELKTVDVWDGTTVDVSWYNDTDTKFSLSTGAQLAGFADLVDGGNTFEGKTILLAGDIDLNGKIFDPIGSYRHDTPFKGTFDGQGNTIYNLSQNTWALDNGYNYGDLGLGFFGLVEDATIKNFTMDGADLSGESAIVGVIASCAYGDMVFENINVKNSKGADYQYYAGGIVGWASGNHQYINCNVDASTTIAAQWGDFDNSNGGLIGGAGGSSTIFVKGSTIACRIDAYNDVTSSYQWYAYRRSGMIIGNTSKTQDIGGTTYAAAPQLTCEDVTVIYGDWANYTYCEFAGTSWPYVRVQAGISNSAYSNPRYGHPKDANGNEVVDDNHVHNDGEDHQILCVFDQLYGGGQGVYGTATHDGVTVIYNN